jgi:hypothetical protein
VIAVFTNADATVIVAIITVIGAPLITMMLRQRRSLEQINRAVNHVGDNEPTLIQRVRDIQADNAGFRKWTHDSMKAIAVQVGAKLDDPPAEHGTTTNSTGGQS